MSENVTPASNSPAGFPVLWNVREVISKPPPKPIPLIDGVIGDSGSITALHGYSGDGKSYAALEMMFAILTGTPFAGLYPVTEGAQRAMLLDIDQAGRATQRRVYQRLNWPEVTEEQKELVCSNFFPFSDGVFDVSKIDHRAQVCNLVLQHKINFLVIDTLAASLGVLDENDSNTTSLYLNFMRSVQGLAIQNGHYLSILIIHHNRKVNLEGHQKMEEEMRGSIGWRAIADYQIPLRKCGPNRFNLHIKKDRHGVDQDKIIQLQFKNEMDETIQLERWKITSYVAGMGSAKTQGLVDTMRVIANGQTNGKTKGYLLEYVKKHLDSAKRPVNKEELRKALEEAMALQVVVTNGATARDPNRYQLFWYEEKNTVSQETTESYI